MFKSDGSSTATAADHADGNFIPPFILDDYFTEITIENFADLFIGGERNDCSCDKKILSTVVFVIFIGDRDGNTREQEDITKLVERTASIFYNMKSYFWKTHT